MNLRANQSTSLLTNRLAAKVPTAMSRVKQCWQNDDFVMRISKKYLADNCWSFTISIRVLALVGGKDNCVSSTILCKSLTYSVIHSTERRRLQSQLFKSLHTSWSNSLNELIEKSIAPLMKLTWPLWGKQQDQPTVVSTRSDILMSSTTRYTCTVAGIIK